MVPDDLFASAQDDTEPTGADLNAPLAVRMRPRTLDEVRGQGEVLRPGSPLRRLVEGSAASGELTDRELVTNAALLIGAGFETTVNLITNGMLTLLRHPDELSQLSEDPGRAPRVIEELLRYEPPVQFRTRRTLDDIDIAGMTIPKGSDLVLLLASGNRDETAFVHPERFDPERRDNRHLGFGGSLHFCVGAPLARFEAEAALVAMARRLKDPRLIEEPPPYRSGASLRGPQRLRLAIAGLRR